MGSILIGSFDLRNKWKQEILEAISELLDSQPSGKMGLEKHGDDFWLWAVPLLEKRYL